ncbi:MAG: Hpt domain-containing protein [Lachnospiraceae bacterium]|nr:Hpt domain-containing protein [Lachnospiraceae bacterium]
MEELLKQKLVESGVDVEGTLHRFMGNEALFMKFLTKFKSDPNYENLKTSLDNEDFEAAFRAAHTLKGVSANLGLTPITQPVSALTELLRGKEASEVDLEQVAVQRGALEEAYQGLMRLMEES